MTFDPTESRQFEWPSVDACDPLDVTPTDDPNVVRSPSLDARDVLAIALFALTGDEAADDVFDAIWAATTPDGTRSLPAAVGAAISERVDDAHRASIGVAAQRLSRTDGTPAMIEIAVHHLIDAVPATITSDLVDRLRSDLLALAGSDHE